MLTYDFRYSCSWTCSCHATAHAGEPRNINRAITVVAEYRGYCSGVADYRPKHTVHYRGGCVSFKIYLGDRLPSKKYGARVRFLLTVVQQWSSLLLLLWCHFVKCLVYCLHWAIGLFFFCASVQGGGFAWLVRTRHAMLRHSIIWVQRLNQAIFIITLVCDLWLFRLGLPGVACRGGAMGSIGLFFRGIISVSVYISRLCRSFWVHLIFFYWFYVLPIFG